MCLQLDQTQRHRQLVDLEWDRGADRSGHSKRHSADQNYRLQIFPRRRHVEAAVLYLRENMFHWPRGISP